MKKNCGKKLQEITKYLVKSKEEKETDLLKSRMN